MINNSAWISFTRNCLRGDGLSRMSIRANHCRRPRQLVSAPPKQRLEALAAFGATAADAILVHSDSRSFRDQFQLAFFVRQLDKSGVRFVSITQELGDASMNNLIHQIMALPAANAATPSPGVSPKGWKWTIAKCVSWAAKPRRSALSSPRKAGRESACPVLFGKWRAQGDSNPCFRRERDAT